LWSSSLCSFLHPPVTSSLISPKGSGLSGSKHYLNSIF
jgi:hypothetical protein